MIRYGSLFSGAGGLDLAVEQVTGATAAWHSEIDPHASTVLAAHWPGVPNLGDITAIDWADVEPVDIICGGFPCQDISSAGRQAGIKEGTRSGLWYRYADAVRALRPRLVVVENVSALVAGGGLGIVVGSLAALGYDATWCSLRASDVGACHRRERVFLIAAPADASSVRLFGHRKVVGGCGKAVASGQGWRLSSDFDGEPAGGHPGADDRLTLLPTPRHRDDHGPGYADDLPTAASLLPTPTTSDTNGPGVHGDGALDLRTTVAMLPTPMVADAEGGRHAKNLEWQGGTAYRPSGAKASISLRESFDLLPTPTTAPSTGNGHARNLGGEVNLLPTSWGRYTDAIARWEHVTGRPAPTPTDDKGRLSPHLTEWMMGWPEGWVTDHVDRRPALRICGNGVVTIQAATALRRLLAQHFEAAA